MKRTFIHNRFRHNYACQLLDNGAPLDFIQGMLGHEKASTHANLRSTHSFAASAGEHFIEDSFTM
ncbi:MAG: tyrosine-type recombinase/integrase [Bacillota bacterium]